MDKNEIKQHLLENPHKIERILAELGCKNIKTISNRYIACSRPDKEADNRGAVNVRLNNSLTVKIYTKNDFENKYEYNDIYALVQYTKDCDLPSAIKFIANVIGVKINFNSKPKERSNSADFLRQFKRKKTILENIKEYPISYKMSDRFVLGHNTTFINEGINSETHDKFSIGYDIVDNRVVFPIRNDIGDILTFKGRTLNKQYKILGTPKYLYYSSCFDARRYLFGLYENKKYIDEANDLIIVEAEKGVMQCDSFGVKNVVSTSKKKISEEQVRKILKIGKPVVLAFDKDVTLEEIKGECRRFKRLIDVYYMWDEDDLLCGKESPSDKGYKIWNKLYENRIKFMEV